MKINVGSPKNDTEKNVTDKKHYRKETVTEKNVTHKHSLTIFTNSSRRWRALNKDISNTCFDIKRRDGLRNAYWDPPGRALSKRGGLTAYGIKDLKWRVTSVTAGRSGVLLREPPSLRATFFATTAPTLIFTALLARMALGLERGSYAKPRRTAAGAPREED